MARIIEITNLTTSYNLELDGEDLTMRLYYSRTVDRWLMDMTNLRLNTSVQGIVINTGTDLLTQAGHLGLQALVALSFPDFTNEADIENFSTNVKLVYLTMAEYKEFRFNNEGNVRTQWIVDRELSLEDIKTIIGSTPEPLNPTLFVKKPASFVSGNLMEFDINGNALDAGSSVQDLLDLVTSADANRIAVAMALALGD